MANFGFPKASRLLRSSEFNAVFANNHFKVASRHFLVLALCRRGVPAKETRIDVSEATSARATQEMDQGLAHPRLGIVAGKKNIPLAVQRNRIKRILRQSFRLGSESFGQLDIVVLVRKDADKLNNLELVKGLDRLWQQLESKLTAPKAGSQGASDC